MRHIVRQVTDLSLKKNEKLTCRIKDIPETENREYPTGF